MNEIRAEVYVFHVLDLVQGRSHQQWRAEIGDMERWLFLFHERPNRLFSDLLANAIVNERILQFDGIFSVELDLLVSA